MVDALQRVRNAERARSDELEAVLDAVPVSVFIAHDPQALLITGNRLSCEWLRFPWVLTCPSPLLKERARDV